MKVEVIPGLESNVTELGFRWNVTSQDEKSLDVQLYFDNPMAVSSNPVSTSELLT